MIFLLIMLCFLIWLSGVMDSLTWYENYWLDENGDPVEEKSISRKVFDVVFWMKEPWSNWRWGLDWILFFKNLSLNIMEYFKNAKS